MKGQSGVEHGNALAQLFDRELHAAVRVDLLSHGPEAYGFLSESWTCRRVAYVIEAEFDVHYDRAHVSRC